MPVSNTSDFGFSLTFDDVLSAAYARVGGEAVSGFEAKSARRAIQVMQIDLANRGMQMWSIETLPEIDMVSGQVEYVLPSDCLELADISLRNPDGTETPVFQIGRADYQAMPNKMSKGRPNQYFINKGRDATTVYVYPCPNQGDLKISGWYRRRLRDVKNFRQNLDMPPEYAEVMISGMAYYVGRELPNVDEQRLGRLRTDYFDALKVAENANADKSPLTIRPNLSAYSS